METITLSGGGALQFTNITECDTWRVTETECDVTMRNMTPTIILFMSLIIASQALFFGGVRNARQNDMWVVVNIVTFLLISHDLHLKDHDDDGDTTEQVHLGLGLVRVDCLRALSPGKMSLMSSDDHGQWPPGVSERMSDSCQVLQWTLWSRKGLDSIRNNFYWQYFSAACWSEQLSRASAPRARPGRGR